MRASSVRVSYSVMIGWLGVPKAVLKSSTIVESRGWHMMRLAAKAGRATPRAVRQVTPVVACHQEWFGRSPAERGADRGAQ